MMDQNSSIPVHEVFRLVRGLIKFPYSKICVHMVASDLLSLLEKYGYSIPAELAQAVVRAEDDKALIILKDIIKD